MEKKQVISALQDVLLTLGLPTTEKIPLEVIVAAAELEIRDLIADLNKTEDNVVELRR